MSNSDDRASPNPLSTKHAQMLAKDVISPILDVFGGADGGVAFATLQHQVLPQLYLQSGLGDPNVDGVLQAVERFSRLCDALLKGKV